MADMTLASDTDLVVVLEAEEAKPEARAGIEVEFDVFGNPVLYEHEPALDLLRISGRLASLDGATQVLLWRDSQEALTLTDRAGTAASGWRIYRDPPPTLRRKDGDSPDWKLDMTLWRSHV